MSKELTPAQFNHAFLSLKNNTLICPKCGEKLKIDKSGRTTMGRWPMVRVKCKNEYCIFEGLIYDELKDVLFK